MKNLKKIGRKEKKDLLKFEGWANIMHASARQNLNSGRLYFVLLDERKAAYNLQDAELYGAILACSQFDRFWLEGELNFRSGWFLNVKEIKLLSASGNLESIRGLCPVGYVQELYADESAND